MAKKKKRRDSTEPCFFCGGPSDTDEHFLSRWYVRRKNPPPRSLGTPTHTKIDHKHSKVPACQRDQKVFKRIEDRILSGRFTQDEAYMWAFKIHAGFWMQDLALDQNDYAPPGSAGTGPLDLTGEPLREYALAARATFRELFRLWQRTDRTFTPSPLGSVFYLPGVEDTYNLGHSPSGYLAVNLGPQLLAVSLFDGGFARAQGYEGHWKSRLVSLPSTLRFKPPPVAPSDLLVTFWMTHMAYATARANAVTRVVVSEAEATVVPAPTSDSGLTELTFFREYSQRFGLYLTDLPYGGLRMRAGLPPE